MNKQIQALALLALTFVVSSCAHHRDVRPGAGGVHKVTVRKPEKAEAEQDAISQAEHYCGTMDKHFVIVSESTKYTGSMDEATRDTLRKASKAAQVVGTGATMARQNRQFQNAQPGTHVSVHADVADPAENPIGTVGTVGHIMTNGDDYLTEMTFKCE